MEEEDQPPVLTAISSSARQLYMLLRCINFAEKAHVQISDEGLKFSVDEASAMEGSAFLDKSLFTTYTYHPPPLPHSPEIHDSESDSDEEPQPTVPAFQISLPSLLETLQILSLTDPTSTSKPWSHTHAPTSTYHPNILGLHNLCRLSYPGPGSPLSIILTESSIRTTCNLTTYEPDYDGDHEIPFDRQKLAFKTIMRGAWLFDAVGELAATGPERLGLVARMVGEGEGRPYFAVFGEGVLGSARVAFNSSSPSTSSSASKSNNKGRSGTGTADNNPDPQTSNVLETFQLSNPGSTLRSSYKFSLIQKAARAMSIATKVSVRVDTQGVLSLQFMIEVEAGKASFVDFRFVPLVGEEGDGDGGGGGDDEGEEEGEDEDEDGEMLVI